MKKIIIFIAALCAATMSRADDSCLWVPNLPGCVGGTSVAGQNSLNVTLVGGATFGAVDQGAPGPLASPWPVEGSDGTNHASYTAGNSENVNVTNSISVTNPSVGPTGSAVPSDANFMGAKDGSGNLVGLLTGQQTMANSLSCVLASDQSDVPANIAQVGGSALSLGNTTMSASVPVTLASDQTPIPNKTVTGSISALNGTVSTNLAGYNVVGITYSGTWSGNIIPEVSIDGVTWVTASVMSGTLTSPTSVQFSTSLDQSGNSQTYQTRSLSPYAQFRMRMSSYTSGTVNITLVLSKGQALTFGVVQAKIVDTNGNSISEGQQTMTGSLPVVVASDQTNLPANLKQFGGTNLATGTGASGAGIPRVTVANDSQVKLWDGSNAASVTASGALKVDNSANTQPISAASLPLPTGASTSANQTTANTTLSAIAAQLPASLGQKAMANSLACTLASDQSAVPVLAPKNSTAAFSQTSVTTTASTISAPANAVRVMIQGDASNTDCIRYRFDGTAATATVGMVAQPGQDSGQLDSGMNVSVASCSGTQKVNVQYLAQ